MQPTHLEYIVNHIFLPPKLPQESDHDAAVKDHSLVTLVLGIAKDYQSRLPGVERPRWEPMTKMLSILQEATDFGGLSRILIAHSICMMVRGDVTAFHIQAQNAAIIFRKLETEMIFESFEAMPMAEKVLSTKGKLIRSFPGPAIAVPLEIVCDNDFRDELASFLEQMNKEAADDIVATTKQDRDSAHPRYITEMLTGILRGLGQPADVHRISKRIADESNSVNAYMSWRRSPLWLVIRVALQTSLKCGGDGLQYKAFMAFLMARILDLAFQNNLSSDILHVMRVKMARRLYKIRSSVPTFVLNEVREVGENVQTLLHSRWSDVQQICAKRRSWNPGELDVPADTSLSLNNSRFYISQTLEVRSSPPTPVAFNPNHSVRLTDASALFQIQSGHFSCVKREEMFTALHDFEHIVQTHLDGWVPQHEDEIFACQVLAHCITNYVGEARQLYDSNPENQSLMLLTVLELWAAMDKIVTKQIPLLKEYSPEVNVSLLEPLLLRKSEQRDRLALLETHLCQRHDQKKAELPSIFSDIVTRDIFPLRYFEHSEEHRSLKLDIEQNAKTEREAKLRELARLTDRYNQLDIEAEALDHIWLSNTGRKHIHASDCRKCLLEKHRNSLQIEIHEWPLPKNTMEANAVVFELRCPVAFGVWRSTTCQVLRDIGTPWSLQHGGPVGSPSSAKVYASLDGYRGLKPYARNLQRISLASYTGSYLDSSCNPAKLPILNQDTICLNNSLKYKLLDSQRLEWAAYHYKECSFARYCQMQLPAGPYQGLQYAVDGSSHTSNMILSDQSNCPKELSIHEYLAFGSLRAGHRLQWLNILRGLRARSLTFRRDEVFTLLAQTAWEVGPSLPSTGERESHLELKIPDFGFSLLAELNILLLSVEANWLELVAVRSIVILASQLLSAATDSGVSEEVHSLLRRARNVTLGWMRQLIKKCQTSEDGLEVQHLRRRACETAAACRSTYDVDCRHIAHLVRGDDDVAIIIECAIVVHDNTPDVARASQDTKLLLDRDRRLAHVLEPILAERIGQSRHGIDKGIAAMWPFYKKGSCWMRVCGSNNRWFTSKAAHMADGRPLCIQYNVLEGEMLVDGAPFGRLPHQITKHDTYTRVFGQKELDVVPATVSSMQFSTRYLVSSHEVFFRYNDNDGELVIKARRQNDDTIFELIPHRKFTGDIPQLLVEGYVHWLNPLNGEIELRPLETMWQTSLKNWRICFSLNTNSIMVSNTSSLRLIDVRSHTSKMICNALSPLEYPQFITTTLIMGSNDLVVDLPRFKLSFFMNDAKLLECRQLSGMVVDENQCVGTMFGLHNRLVLRSLPLEGVSCRYVIIPHGKLQLELSGHHVSVKIDTESQRQVRYQKYQVDDMLGRLVGNASLMNRLFKVYLHAVTAHVLPDPLTQCTGTEEALNELQSAGCRSFQQLSPAEAEILTLIGSLTPYRRFYPSYLNTMQWVEWCCLPPTSQHYGFHACAKSIIEDAQRFKIFQAKTFTYSDRGDLQLLERGGLRHSIYYSAEFAGVRHSTEMDAIYHARDCATDGNDRECLVWTTVQTIRRWPSRLDIRCDILETFRSWRNIEGPQCDLPLCYNLKWLRPHLASKWLSIYDSLRTRPDRDRYDLMFFFSSIAYGSPEIQKFIHVMLAFAITPRFRHLDLPPYPSYDLADGSKPCRDTLLTIARGSACPFENRPHALSTTRHAESQYDLHRSCQSPLESNCQAFVDDLVDQWPCEEPNLQNQSNFPNLQISETTVERIKVLFHSWYRNWKLESHARLVQAELDRVHCPGPGVTPLTYEFTPSLHLDPSTILIYMSDLLWPPAPMIGPVPSPPATLTVRTGRRKPHISNEAVELLYLVSEFQGSSNGFRRLYGRDLMKSCRALTGQRKSPVRSEISSSIMQAVTEYRNHCLTYLEKTLSSIISSLTASSPAEKVMVIAGIWPRIRIRSLLAQLALTARTNLIPEWKRVVVSLAEAIISLQCSVRMIGYAVRGETAEFFREVENMGVHSWDTFSNPDSLLIQIEGNFHLRHIQAEIALQMMTPTSRQNTVLQLNMGEGKSSVITPIVAASLADRTKLVRVVVLKPLATQMFQMLVQRLGGLTNRRVFYMPFSRSVQMGGNEIKVIQDMYEECMDGGGILLTQPEHILSFKLMGIERSLSPDSCVGDTLLKSQLCLDDKTRDILDESDEILHVRYQLIYSVGARKPLEHHPDRWTTIQQVFSLVRKHAPDVQKVSKFGIEIRDSERHGAFPHLRILQDDAATELISLIAEDICASSLPNISFCRYPERFREMASNFITNKAVRDDTAKFIKHQCDESAGDWNTLLLLRGLLAHGILTFTLKEKRWRVDYGLDSRRTLLAVPYRAKDSPSLSSEFGHPEVAIALTCLSYYYSGLSEEQLDLCFERLLRLDNSTLEYERWLRNIDAPEELQQLSGVNTKDIDQRQDYLVPLFQANQSVIDFFLDQVVFPNEAKEFPHKMTSSGWDIAQRKQHISTGFSGTNDSQYLLPLSIVQGDLEQVASTNATVLSYLLLPENGDYMCAKDEHGNKLSAKAFLGLIAAQKPSIQVLLDVGAQMLELQNKDLCIEWLSLIPDARAAIFFDENDSLSVVGPDGTVESFISSPFSQQLDQCLVYLDDAHTRGTDLKLPLDSRAAVALGPKLTNARLLQCCMRMRKLGQGHSLMFFAPPEVDRIIRETSTVDSDPDHVGVPDILRWVMSETCADIQHHLPHWAHQGMDYQSRHMPWRDFRSGNLLGHNLAKAWLRPEEKTLETLYIEQNRDVSFERRLLEMSPRIQEQCRRLGVKSLETLQMEEEQEREVEQEVQNEHHIERPPKAAPATHEVHQDLKEFVRVGTVPMSSDAIIPAFSTLAQTAAIPPNSNSVWSPHLFATADFSKTIQVESSNTIDDYMRPVHWILSNHPRPENDPTLVVISPHEANELLPDIRRSNSVQLHMYTSKVTQVMKASDDLNFYNVPSSKLMALSRPLAIQLNLFAGQLYLQDYSTYLDLCNFLGILASELPTGDLRVQRDGFIERDLDDPPAPGRFQTSPLPFLKELFGLRRKGQSYFDTHLGKILHSRMLTENDFRL